MPIDSGPARTVVAVAKSDTTIYACRALYVGTTGDLTLDTQDGGINVVFKAVPAGTVLPVAALRVKNATTAADIVALY